MSERCPAPARGGTGADHACGNDAAVIDGIELRGDVRGGGVLATYNFIVKR
jgi:hypothetical protein